MAGNKSNIKIGSVHVAYLKQGASFRWLGYSEGGPGLNYSVESADVFVDQLTTALFTNITGETLELSFPSVEITKENISLAFPGAVIRGNTVDIYPASSVIQSDITGIVLVHPVFAGEPVGDVVDFSDPNYDSSHDIMFYATPTAQMDISFTREDMQHLNLTFRATPDPLGRIMVWDNPMEQDFDLAVSAMTGAVGTPITESLTASGGASPYTYVVAGMPGWSVSGSTLTFNPTETGEFQTIVYAKDAEGGIAAAIAKATIS